MQLIVQKKGYRWLPLLALAVATALLVLVARDSLATHNDGQLELDGNTAFNGGTGADPGTGNCPYVFQSGPVDGGAVDCISNPAAYDWSDDSPNVIAGDQGVCKPAGASNLITQVTSPAKGDQRVCIRDFAVPSVDGPALGVTGISTTADLSYHTGSDKDYQEIWDGSSADWGCTELNNATNKSDLLNSYVTLVKPSTGQSANNQLVFVGAERASENGTVFNGFWLLQNSISSDCPRTVSPPGPSFPSANGDFCSQTNVADSTCTAPDQSLHKCNDVLILFNYTSGGRIGNIGAYQWVADPSIAGFDPAKGCDQIAGNADDCTAQQLASSETHAAFANGTQIGVICLKTPVGGGDCRLEGGPGLSGDLCGRVNGTTGCAIAPSHNEPNPPPCSGPGAVLTPWAPGCSTTAADNPTNSNTNCIGALPSPTFSEAGADLTGLGIVIGCVSSFVAETRSSASVTATLKDYAIGSFPACGLAWEKRDESVSGHPLQGGATFTVGSEPAGTDGDGKGIFACNDVNTTGDDDKNPVTITDNLAPDTDSDAGQFKLNNACPGTYKVCESSAPGGYAPDDSLCRIVVISLSDPSATIGTPDVDDCANATADEQDFCNRRGSLAWEKRDATASTGLQGGATFTVSPNPDACVDADNTGPDDASPVTVVDDESSALPDTNLVDDNDASGVFEVGPACLATYTITETVPPTGYVLPADPDRTCEVTASALTCVVGTQGTDDCQNADANEQDFCNRLGSLEWEKRSDIDGALQAGATFNITPNPYGCHVPAGTNPSPISDDADGTDGPAGDGDEDGTGGQLKLDRVCTGTYTITEASAPTGFDKDPDDTRTCTVSATELNCVVGTQGTAQDCPDTTGVPDADHTAGVAGSGADFCNPVGSLFWEKRGKDASTLATGDELLPGFGFSVTGTGVSYTSIADCVDTTAPIACTAGAGLDQDPDAGQFCLDAVPLGVLLTIDETSKVTGYIQTSPANDGDLTATLTQSSKCSGTPTDAGDFINEPLAKFEIKFICVAHSPSDSSQCATQAKITCPTPAISPTPDDSTPTAFDDTDEVYGDGTTTLLPGTYNCTVEIDP